MFKYFLDEEPVLFKKLKYPEQSDILEIFVEVEKVNGTDAPWDFLFGCLWVWPF